MLTAPVLIFLLLQAVDPAVRNACKPLGPFCFNPELKFADFLTPITVLVSLLTVLFAIGKERSERRASSGERIRSAAAKTLSQLERWRSLSMSLYVDVQPLFVEISDALASKFDVPKARDALWKDLAGYRAKKAEQIPDEALEAAYVELSSYYSRVYEGFTKTLSLMREIDEGRYNDLVQITQFTVLSYEAKKNGYQPAALGNHLREVNFAVFALLRSQLEEATANLRSFLVNLIKCSDQELLAQRATAELPLPPVVNYPSLLKHGPENTPTAMQPSVDSTV